MSYEGKESIRRVSSIGSPDDQVRNSWYVNSSSGSDSNDGLSPATPIATIAEIARRTGGVLKTPTVVYILSAHSESFFWDFKKGSPNASLKVVGQRNVLRSSSFTSVRGWALSGQVDGYVADTSLTTGWLADGYEGKLIRDVGAQRDFWLTKASQGTPKQGRGSLPVAAESWDDSDGYTTSGSYQVIGLTAITGSHRFSCSGITPKFVDLAFGTPGGPSQSVITTSAEFYACEIWGIDCDQGGQGFAFGCKVSACKAKQGSRWMIQWGTISDETQPESGGTIEMTRVVTSGQSIKAGTSGTVILHDFVSTWDHPNGVDVGVNGLVDSSDGRAWGYGSSYGVKVASGGRFIVSPAYLPVFRGSPKLALIGASERTTMGEVPFTESGSNASFLVSTGIIPPQLVNCTFWWRCDLSFPDASPEGANLTQLIDLMPASRDFNGSGPTLVGNAFNGRPAIDFDGVDDNYISEAPFTPDDFMNVGSKELIFVLSIDSVDTDDATFRLNEGCFGYGSGYGGLHFRSTDGTVAFHNFDTGPDDYATVTQVPRGTGSITILRLRHTGGSIFLRRDFDNAGEGSAISGDTGGLTGSIDIGRSLPGGGGASSFGNFKLLEVVISDTAQSVEANAALDTYLKEVYHAA